jgi:hypothetical protein
MFQLTEAEKLEVVANCDHVKKLKFSPSVPYAFTEHGTIMAANVLNSQRARGLAARCAEVAMPFRQEFIETWGYAPVPWA